MRYRVIERGRPPYWEYLGFAADTLEALRDEVERLIRERDARRTTGKLLTAVGNAEFSRVVVEACESVVWDEWYGETGGEG